MNDTWTTMDELISIMKSRKSKKIEEVRAALSEKVVTWDTEIFFTNLWMTRKMVHLGSHSALSDWMRSDDKEAVTLRWWIEKSGHREIISVLFRRLKDLDVAQLKTILYEG